MSSGRFFAAFALAIAAAVLALPSAAPAATLTFSNPSPISIPAEGNAALYPSTIASSGFVGPVQDVNATIRNLEHTSETDISVLLVGPGGQSTILMSGAGSATGIPAGDETLTFDDEAASSLPCGQLTSVPSGSYKPTRGSCFGTLPEAFTAPAPAGPYPVALSGFDGATANGNWTLFVRDEATGDGGVMAGGWTVTVTAPTDITAPETRVTKGPRATTKKKRATFRFASSEPGSTFECRLDRNLGFSPCASPQTVHKLGLGKHTFEVRAKDHAGNTDATPATATWKVKRKLRQP